MWSHDDGRSDKPCPDIPKTANTEDNETKVHHLHIGTSQMECARESWDSSNLKKPVKSYLAWNIRTTRVNVRLFDALNVFTQSTVETANFTLRTSSKEGEDCSIGRTGDDHRSPWFTRSDLHSLHPKPNYGADSTPNCRKIETLLFHHYNALTYNDLRCLLAELLY